MKLIHAAVAIGVAASAMSRTSRAVEQDRRSRQKEAETRWEGEGGSIPEVEAQRADSYGSAVS